MIKDSKSHSFDLNIDNNEVQLIERSSFYAAAAGPEGEPGVDTFGTFGSAGTLGGCFGCMGTAGCCC